MPERLITIILILHTVFTTACSHNAGHSRDVEQRLEELDRTIEERDRFEAIKTQYIDRIKSKITPGCTEMQRYGIYDNLYDEYYQYNLDSATFYARTKLEVADRIGSPSLKYDAILDIADRYILSGMYVEASEYISQIDAGQLPHELLPRYYHVYHAYYDGMATNAGDPQLREEYLELKSKYRKLLFEKLGEDDIARLYILTDILCDEGRASEALEELLAKYDTAETTRHEQAILAYLIATVYQLEWNSEQAIIYYTERPSTTSRHPYTNTGRCMNWHHCCTRPETSNAPTDTSPARATMP